MTSFSSSPYFDDFDVLNNFYRVLFKPGYGVQTRELNQLQSILQHQISSVGKHLFKKNSIVIPGGIALANKADIISITGLDDITSVIGKTITNATTFSVDDDSTLDGYITAIVLASKEATDTSPAALYIKYIKGQADGRFTFNKSEALKTVDNSAAIISFSVDDTVGATLGRVATLSAGTFFTKDIFVDTNQQYLILEVDNSVTTSCIVGLNIIESIVTSDNDSSLLDNSANTSNQYAPGADRYKIELVLTRIDNTTTIDDNMFIKMMVIENNTTTFLNNNTQYAELLKTLAQRTYDANGNFIVHGLDTSITSADNNNYVYANVSAGKCYLGGYEYDQLVNTPIALKKPRESEYQQQVNTQVKYTSGMTYMYIAGGTLIKELPVENSLVQIIDRYPLDGILTTANVIGYGIYRDIQYYTGNIGSSDIYKVFFDYIALEKGYTFADIGGIKTINGEGIPVLQQLKLTNVIGVFGDTHTVKSATDLTQSAYLYHYLNGFAYVLKINDDVVPNTETIIDTTSNATASLTSSFISNYDEDSIPMIEVDGDVIKTLYNNNNVNPTSFSIIRKDVINITSAGVYTVTLPANSLFDDYSTSNFYGFVTNTGSEEFIDLTGLLTITGGGSQYQLTIGAGSELIGKLVWIYSTVITSNVVEAKKVITSVTDVITNPSQSWMALSKQDVVSIEKIVAGNTVSVDSASWATNVATINTTEAHNLVTGDTVYINLHTSIGYNKLAVVTVIDTDTFTYSLTTNPGTFTSSIYDIVALPPNINTDTDITDRYNYDSGNQTFICCAGSIKLKKGAVSPTGQIAIKYNCMLVDSVGGYVSVDSYGDYESADLSYIGNIKDIVTDKRTIESRRYIDFRTRASSYYFKNIAIAVSGSNTIELRDLNLSLKDIPLVGKYVIGPGHLAGATITEVIYDSSTGNTKLKLSSNATKTSVDPYYIGLNTASLSLVDTSKGGRSFEVPKDSTRFSYQYVKFLPRHIMIYINRSDDVLQADFKEVADRQEVVQYRRNEFKLPLAYIFMKPYSIGIQDVSLEKFENPVYQMIDIHNIKQRVDRNEYYVTLALNKDIHEEITAAAAETTQSSYGLWAEDFQDLTNQDYSSDDFACTIYDKNYVGPGTVTHTIPVTLKTDINSSTWQQTGTAITLPYTEVTAFANNTASRFNNLNPFNIVNWTGKMVLNPSVDNWVDTTVTTGVVNNTTTNTTTTVTIPAAAVTQPPVAVPVPVVEIVTEITNLKTSWGRDSAGGYHAITFDWKTNLGKTGRVNTDKHLSAAVAKYGYDGKYAKSLIGKQYDLAEVKSYLHAGTGLNYKK